MILVADGGSTKTDWRLIADNSDIISFQTKGMNPLFTSDSEIINELDSSVIKKYIRDIKELHFYGAGLVNQDLANKMTSVFKKFFSAITGLSIYDDLTAAARALFGQKDGIACILGTGSNSCLYKNGVIEDKVPALGYILGDEGSGAHIGKRFLNDILKRQLPVELTNKICEENNININSAIENTYKKSFPNRYLASLTKIAINYIEHKEIKAIVRDSFKDFIVKNILHYEDHNILPIGFVGSVGFHFNTILTDVLEEFNLNKGPVKRVPIDELVNYHKRKQ